jgi:hypothetical protein
MNYNNLKKKKSIIIFSDGSFIIRKNSVLKKIIFFEKDDRNSTLWVKKVDMLKNPTNKFNYFNKFLIKK